MKTISFKVDDDLYKAFSKKCIDRELTRKDVLMAAMQAWIESVLKEEKQPNNICV